MRRLTLALALAATLAMMPIAGLLQAGEVSCCVCSECLSGPSSCRLPPLSCDVACGQVGCSGFMSGSAPQCNPLTPCAAAAPVAAAPAASGLGIAAIVAVLAAIGLVRLSRRRA